MTYIHFAAYSATKCTSTINVVVLESKGIPQSFFSIMTDENEL